ncbi:MAG: prephenate dehydrogenase/arogenate dehydrogenase family protein [Clostridia bacterium]|nr:prephenate dehydrogenase/arogenate dehydrogenase family protein [Clostridia bacterium]
MKIGIIGLGLMGGSFGKALVKKTNHIVYGYDLSNTVIEKAISLNAIHYVLDTNNLSELDMLVVAIRPEFFTSSLTPFLPRLKKGAIVTDFCGVKRSIVDKMANFSKEFSNLVFVGGHPMAGRELSGINHSQSSLFDKASMILVNVNANANDIEILKDLYLSIGFSKVVETSSENHDSMIAYTSQLCHIVSNAFIKNAQAEKHVGYSAGSYLDLTRVARMNADMWAGLMLANGDKLLSELDEFLVNLTKYRDALKDGDVVGLRALLQEGNERKIQIDVKRQKTLEK